MSSWDARCRNAIRKRVLACALLWIASTAVAPAAILVAVTDSQELIRFDSSSPSTILSTVPITGLLPGDTIRGIDVRPATGMLYGLAVNNPLGADEGRIYLIDPASGIAVLLGNTPFSTVLSNSAFYGIDFDPVADVIRVVNTADQNFRVNATTGAQIAQDTNLTHASDSEEVAGIAYNGNDSNPATASTLYGINFATNTLVRIGGVGGSPSADGGGVATIGPLGVTLGNRDVGFDISASGVAYTSLFTSANGWRLYVINLTNGALTNQGAIGTGNTAIRGIAVLFSSSANIVKNLQTGENFASIQAAINDAETLAGHIIEVGAGTRSELVTVSKAVTLRGPNFGLHGSATRAAEAILNGGDTSPTRTTSFNVTASGVTIDGFTVEGATNQGQFGAGIRLAPGSAGSRIWNNIIRNNIIGLKLANSSISNQTVISRNSFQNNNQPGAGSGSGIYSDQFEAGGSGGGPLTNVLINDNSFIGNGNGTNGGAAINLSSTSTGSQTAITISNNIFDNNARSLLAFNLVNSSFTHNTATNSNFSGSAELRLFEGVSNLRVTNNILQGNGANLRGLRITNIGTGAPDATGIVFECNSISGYGNAGLELENGAYNGTLQATLNWWGAASGPTIASNPGGTGLAIIDPAAQVVYAPFATVGTDYEPLTPGFECRPTAILYGVDSANTLLRFNSATPETIDSSVAITGLLGGESILGIDFRPTTGELFAVGSANRLYTINRTNGAASLVAGLAADPTDTTTPFAGLSGSRFGTSFNPVPDLAGNPSFRVISNTNQNLRINAVNGLVTTDTNINPAGFALYGAGYTNNDLDPGTGTTLYAYDFAEDDLVSTASANAGTYFVVGSSGVTSVDEISMDIQTLPGTSNRAFATIQDSVRSNLYRLDLGTGLATPIGPIGPNAIVLRALAVQPAGTFSFSAPTYTVGESGPAALITINRLGGSAGSVEVTFSTSNGTATAPGDYTDSDQVVAFANGVSSVVVSVPLVNDFATEASETINLALSNPTGGALLLTSGASAVLTITDNDSAGIAITKLTNGTNNNAPPGAAVPIGSTVTFTYTVTNTGNVPLAVVTVRDDNGTAANVADDFNATFQNGDTNGNGLLDVSETFNFIASRIASSGQHTNIGTASGTPSGGGAAVSASDSDNHFGVSPTPTPTPTPPPGLVANVATRLPVGIGDNVLIEGFIVLGPGGSTKKIIVRALGPFLTQFGITDALANPTLEIRDGGNNVIARNNDWRNTQVEGIITGDQAAEIEGSNLAPTNDFESAIIANLAPGNYTAVVSGVNNTVGTGIVDAFDLSPGSPARLANVATRGLIQPGDQLMIAGFIIQQGDVRAVVRAIGPSLAAFGITNALPNTTLEVRNQDGTFVMTNDDWESDQKAELEATGLQPSHFLEAAIVATLPPGQYSALVRGQPESTGIGVVEIYFLQ